MTTEEERASRVASLVVGAGAVNAYTETAFRWSSGILAPLYIDHRLLIGLPRVRRLLVAELCASIDSLALDDYSLLGVPMGGSPWAAIIAHELNKPLLVMRSSRKEYGKKKDIEGAIGEAKDIVIVEDAVTTGASVLRTVESALDSGLSTKAVVSLLDYDFPFNQLRELPVPARSLYRFRHARVALMATVSSEVIQFVTEWHDTTARRGAPA